MLGATIIALVFVPVTQTLFDRKGRAAQRVAAASKKICTELNPAWQTIGAKSRRPERR